MRKHGECVFIEKAQPFLKIIPTEFKELAVITEKDSIPSLNFEVPNSFFLGEYFLNLVSERIKKYEEEFEKTKNHKKEAIKRIMSDIKNSEGNIQKQTQRLSEIQANKKRTLTEEIQEEIEMKILSCVWIYLGNEIPAELLNSKESYQDKCDEIEKILFEIIAETGFNLDNLEEEYVTKIIKIIKGLESRKRALYQLIRDYSKLEMTSKKAIISFTKKEFISSLKKREQNINSKLSQIKRKKLRRKCKKARGKIQAKTKKGLSHLAFHSEGSASIAGDAYHRMIQYEIKRSNKKKHGLIKRDKLKQKKSALK